MSYRFMRMLVFFDLPTETADERRHYRRFRKLLLDSGFIMMQESVYCKLLINASAERAVIENIRKNKPPKGIVQTLTITEKQFSKMEFICGDFETDIVNNDARMVIL